MSNIQDYAASFKAATTHKQRAYVEEMFWRQALSVDSDRRTFLSKHLGSLPNESSIRGMIFNLKNEDFKNHVWGLIDDQGLSIYSIVKLVRESRAKANKFNTDHYVCFLETLTAWNSKNSTVHTKNGRTSKRRNPSDFKERSTAQSMKIEGGVWDVIRKAISQEMSKRLEGIDPLAADKLWKEFEVEVKGLLDSFQYKLYAVRKKETSGAGITQISTTRREIIDACKTLHIDPPKTGEKVDMKLAKKMKHKLVKLYHPDVSGNKDSRPHYEAVIQAYDLLEKYTETLATA